MASTIVGIGEALFDVFPSGARVLGGAPLNFAVHARQLTGSGVLVSRVGQDEPGAEAIRSLERFGVDTQYIQGDPVYPTGRVTVGISATGQPEYTIEPAAAWDFLRFEDTLTQLAESCDAVCFGSLAQRTQQARETIRLFLELAKDAIRLFDVNLRQNWYDFATLIDGCNLASAIKLNVDELDLLIELFGFPPEDGVRSFFHHFPIDHVVLTRGELGTVLYTPTGEHAGEPAPFDPSPDADCVGAGDSCAAAVVAGLLARLPLDEVATTANRVGAFVASRPGATPVLPAELAQAFR
jgi:fructokinase